MAERLAGALAGHGEHEQARGSIVSDNDLRLARVVVPLERDRVTSIVACVEFYKHASSVRLQPTTRTRVRPGLPTGSTGCAPRAASSGRAAQTGACGSRRSATRGDARSRPRESPGAVAG